MFIKFKNMISIWTFFMILLRFPSLTLKIEFVVQSSIYWKEIAMCKENICQIKQFCFAYTTHLSQIANQLYICSKLLLYCIIFLASAQNHQLGLKIHTFCRVMICNSGRRRSPTVFTRCSISKHMSTIMACTKSGK